jgi:hypothetical protein
MVNDKYAICLNTALLLCPSKDQSWKWKTSSNEIGKFNLIQHREVSSQHIIVCLHFTMDDFCWPLPYQGQGYCCVFRFIIEYSSLRDFYRPLVNNRSLFIWAFLKDGYFGLCWNLRLVIIELWYLERILVAFRGIFFEDYVFAWWNLWVSIILRLP